MPFLASFGSGAKRKNSPFLVIPKPGLSARNLLAAGSEAADSSRDKAALRNDNSLGFSITPISSSVFQAGYYMSQMHLPF
jgi:hypothetical protein